MCPTVTSVEARDDYTLAVAFDSGESGVLDMKGVLDFGIFKRLRDQAAFRRVRLCFPSIAWDCGADLDPEYVYAHACGCRGHEE